jgi:tRNA-intron endonuclease
MAKKKQKEAKNEELPAKDTKAKDRIEAFFLNDIVKARFEGFAKENYDNGRFGEFKDNEVLYALVEAMFLMEREKMEIRSGRKCLNVEEFLKKAVKAEPNFWVKYQVYKDMRTRGYIVKTALKFGADFRIYERGVKPGEDHAKWILYPVNEGAVLTWHEFSAKNRVAHSTRKKLLIGVVDSEGDVTYWQVNWVRP